MTPRRRVVPWAMPTTFREYAPLVLFYAFLALALGAIVLVRWSCSTSECASVCEANGDAPKWTWTQGCYCRDAEGLYNPADSRDSVR